MCVYERSTIIVRLMSMAGTGFFYTATRPRAADKMTFRKYDPVGVCAPFNPLSYVCMSSWCCSVREHVLFKEAKKSGK